MVVLAAAVALTGESESFRRLYESRGAVASIRDNTRETIALIGRTPTKVALAALYVLSLPAYVLLEWVRGAEVEGDDDSNGESTDAGGSG